MPVLFQNPTPTVRAHPVGRRALRCGEPGFTLIGARRCLNNAEEHIPPAPKAG